MLLQGPPLYAMPLSTAHHRQCLEGFAPDGSSHRQLLLQAPLPCGTCCGSNTACAACRAWPLVCCCRARHIPGQCRAPQAAWISLSEQMADLGEHAPHTPPQHSAASSLTSMILAAEAATFWGACG